MRRFERDFRNRTPRRHVRTPRPLFENRVSKKISYNDMKNIIILLKQELMEDGNIKIVKESGHLNMLKMNYINTLTDEFFIGLRYRSDDISLLTDKFMRSLRKTTALYCVLNCEYELEHTKEAIVLTNYGRNDTKYNTVKTINRVVIPLSEF